MQFDLQTLMIAASFIAATGGAFLIFAWWNDQSDRPMLWWAAANFTLAGGLPFLVQAASTTAPSLVFGLALLTLSPAFIWASARCSNERPVDLVFLFSGPVVWLAAIMVLPLVDAGTESQMAVSQALIAFYLFAAAREFAHERTDHITAREPLIVLLVLHGMAFGYGAFESMRSVFIDDSVTLALWLQLVHFETLVFLIGTSIFAVAMMREKNELRQKIMAETDALTGLLNRGAFFRTGETVLAETSDKFATTSVIVFDLDGFKDINDTYGHPLGDSVLTIFGETARSNMRTTDVVGRIGGEEFAAVLPETDPDEARIVANRVRQAFCEASREIGLKNLQATFSAGISSSERGSSLGSLVGLADVALYKAKANGRNRIETFRPGSVEGMHERRVREVASAA